MKKTRPNSLAIIIFLLLFGYYLKLLAPTISPGDSPELITAAYNLGVGHPPGYPFYLLVSKIWTFLPVGEIAFRQNLLNSLLNAGNSSLIFILVLAGLNDKKLSWLIALGGSLFFGLISATASMSVISEVYPLFWLCLILTIYSLKKQNYFAATLLSGLGIAGHYAFLLLVPGLLCWTTRKFWQPGNLIFVIFLASLGLLTIIYLPLRARQAPTPSWGEPVSYQKLLAKITLKDWENRTEVKRGKSWSDYLQQAIYLARICWSTFGIFLLFWLAGLIMIYQENRFYALGHLVMYSVFFLAMVQISAYPSWAEAYALGPKFLTPMFIIMLLPVGKGLLATMKFCPKQRRTYLAVILCLSLPLSAFSRRASSERRNFLAFDYACNLLNSLPSPDYGILSTGDVSSFPLAYVKYVRGYYPASQITGSAIFPAQKFNQEKTLFTAMPLTDRNEPFPAYRLFFITPESAPPPDWPSFYRIRGFNNQPEFTDMMSRFTLSKYRLFRSLFLMRSGKLNRGLEEISRASELSGMVVGEHYNYGLLLKYYGRRKVSALRMAVREFNYFSTAYPQILPGFYQAGLTLEILGEKEKAAAAFQKIYQKNPAFADAAFRLGRLLILSERYKDALAPLKTASGLEPSADVYNFLGIAFEETGQDAKALENYKKALDLNPRERGIYYNYQRLLEKKKDQGSLF